MGQAWAWTAWVWWSAAGLLGVIGLTLAAWSLFADRSRGRRRCRKCWYIMDGLDSLRCPECGWETTRISRLYGTRRRWRWFVFALILLGGGYACYLTPKGQRDGWVTVIPSSVLVLIVPTAELASDYPLSSHPLTVELYRRAAERRLAAWQWRVMLDRHFRTQGERISDLIAARRRWPEQVPLHVRARVPGLVFSITRPNRDDILCRVRLRSPQGPWVEFDRSRRDADALRSCADLGLPAPGVDQLIFDYELVIDDLVVWSTEIRKPVEVRGTIEDVIEPASDRDADLLARRLRPRLVRFNGPDVKIWVDVITPRLGEPNEMCVGYRAEVLRDGEVVAYSLASAAPRPKGRISTYAPDVDIPTRWLIPQPDTISDDGSTWLIRISSDVGLALIAAVKLGASFWPADEEGCRRFWEGQFTVPVERIETHW